jgi:SPP1 gp7 family putative phage head morphogenesis protein
MINETLIHLDSVHQTSVNRYGTTLANKVIPFLVQARNDLESQLLKDGLTIRNKTRLSQILSATRATLSEYYGGYTESLFLGLDEFVEPELNFISEMMNTVIVDYDVAIPAPAQVISAATNNPMLLETGAISMSKAMSNWQSQEITRVQNAISLGYFEGQTTNQIVRNMKSIVGGITTRNAQTIARTALNHVANEARMETYKENDDLIIGYRWISTIDGRTSAICRDRDQNVYLFTDKFQPRPPAHFMCRSSTTPELDGRFSFLDEGETRASQFGQVPSSESYYEWLKKQPASMQDEVLGKTKGKIFRNAGLTIDEFKRASINRMGKELTIGQMAGKNQKIMDYLRN